MKKFLTSLFVTLFAFLFMVNPASAYSAEEIVDKTKVGVGIISIGEGCGTCFAIGKTDEPIHYLVTCCHCVMDDNGCILTNSLSVYIRDPEKKYLVSVVEYDEEHDLAILESEEALTGIEPLALAHKDAGYNDTVYAVGYPESMYPKDDEGKPQFDPTQFDLRNPKCKKGEIRNLHWIINSEVGIIKDTYKISMEAERGMSGGPIVNENGYVIGVQESAGREEDKVVSFAVKINHLKEMLRLYEIDYEEEPGDVEAETMSYIKSIDGKLVGISIAVYMILAVVIAAVVVYFFKKSKVGKKR